MLSAPNSCSGTLDAVGIKIDNIGSNTQINNTTEALNIHAAWLAAGSPATGFIDGVTYNVAASGNSTVDRIDFGGAAHDFSGTLPYPGVNNGVTGSDFLVHTSGTITLAAGDYTIFVESDDGFSFVMDTVSGDAVAFNKFGGSTAGSSNELRFETPTGNSNTGGSFTLTQDSVFDISAIFFERGGGDYLEISIANDIRTNYAPAGYEILRDGAISDKVKFGNCSSPLPLLEYRFEELVWNGNADEIIDETGNGYHAQVNRNSIPALSSPALSGNPGSCGYASQTSGSIAATGLPLDTSTNGVKTTVTFWMNWDGTDNVMPVGWYLHDIWIFDGFMGFNTGAGDIYGISSAGLANGWHHVAVEFTNGSVTSNKMYIDGVEQVLAQRRGSPNNTNAYVNSELRIGGWSRDGRYGFHGQIDEVRVYQAALTTAQVNTIMAERHPCPSPPVAEYRFDELFWDLNTSVVFDSSGNLHHGVSVGMSTSSSGKICSAGDFTATGTSDYLSLASTAADGLNDFSISVWAKTNGINTATILSGANVGQYNEMIMFFSGNNNFSPHVKGSKVDLNNGAIADNDWHHLVWTREGALQCYYVDGALVQCGNTSSSGALSIAPGALIVGQEQDTLGGGFDASQAWDGLLDELIIFNSALPSSQITTIYNHQNAGNNYDGSSRICPVPPTPLLEFRFEESNWDGTAGEVIDETGNGYHGQVNNNSTPINTSPALTGNPGTCSYASQTNGSIEVTGLPLDTSTAGVKTTVTFWMNWDGTDNVMPLGWNFHDIWIRNGSIGFNTFNTDIYGTTSAGLANGWHHIAVEFTNGSVTDNRMYIDGVEQVLTQRFGTPNNARAFVNSQMRVGGVANSSGYNFYGLLDEVRVYQGALNTTQIMDIMAERHPCNVPIIHHYEISHDGQGLTCESETLTVKACTDSSCSNLSTEVVSLELLADGALISAPTFIGSTAISFNHTNVETLTLSIANATIAASDPVVCDDGSGTSCDIVFSDAGFKFLYGAGNSSVIPNQTSGAVFNDTLKIQAVENTNGVCTGLFTGNQAIDLSQENVNPGGAGGLSFSVNGNTIAKYPSSTSTTLNFGADSIATIPAPVYHDAGRIRLHAAYDVAGVSLVGSSNNSFWVSPAELIVTAKSGTVALNGSTATATPTHKAGDDFILTVSAYNAANPSVITPNYSPGQIQFKLERTGPTLASSVNGELSYAAGPTLATSTTPIFTDVTLSNFSAGVSTYGAAQYSEVGLVNLEVQDRNYGNEGIVIPSTAINIGRFIPDHFESTVVENGSFLATCNTGTTFAYSGQTDEATQSIGAISYLANPVFEITAYNKQGVITQNYFEDSQGSANDYMKLSSTDINITEPTFDEFAIGVDTNKLPVTANITTGTLSQNDLTVLPNVVALPKGVLHYQLSDSDNFFYNRSANAKVAPFTSNLKISTAAFADPEGVSSIDIVDASPTGVEIRFGRLLLENSYGPETSTIPQPMQIEHFDGANFIVTDNNNCVNYDASKVLLSNISLNPTLTSALGGTGSFVNGKTKKIELDATGAGNQGQIGVEYDTFDWLKYDWNNSGLHNQNPSAVATFGLFRGNDRVIYWREVSN
ncbi:hypothetical protein GCM10025767_04340 [Thalassotalea piscium]